MKNFVSGAITSFEYRDIQLIYLNSALRRLASHLQPDRVTHLTYQVNGWFFNGR